MDRSADAAVARQMPTHSRADWQSSTSCSREATTERRAAPPRCRLWYLDVSARRSSRTTERGSWTCRAHGLADLLSPRALPQDSRPGCRDSVTKSPNVGTWRRPSDDGVRCDPCDRIAATAVMNVPHTSTIVEARIVQFAHPGNALAITVLVVRYGVCCPASWVAARASKAPAPRDGMTMTLRLADRL
jgi:hypothetical protein